MTRLPPPLLCEWEGCQRPSLVQLCVLEVRAVE